MLKKEVVELKHALKKHVKVSDLPKKSANLLHVHYTPEGKKKIESQAHDVGEVLDDIKDKPPMYNFGNALEKWGKSKEVAHIKDLDKKFLATPQGKKLIKEWKDFGEALKTHVHVHDNGVYLDNSAGLDEVVMEGEDVALYYERLGKTTFAEGKPWRVAYDDAWKAATTSKEAHNLAMKWRAFHESHDFKRLQLEMKELKMAIKKNVKVTDIPE